MVGWHRWLNRHVFEQSPEDSEGQGSLACWSPRGHKELDMTEWLNDSKWTAQPELGESITREAVLTVWPASPYPSLSNERKQDLGTRCPKIQVMMLGSHKVRPTNRRVKRPHQHKAPWFIWGPGPGLLSPEPCHVLTHQTKVPMPFSFTTTNGRADWLYSAFPTDFCFIACFVTFPPFVYTSLWLFCFKMSWLMWPQHYDLVFAMAQMERLPAMQETQVWSLD